MTSRLRGSPVRGFDSTFDGDGKKTIDLGGWDFGFAVAIDSIDRVVIAGPAFDTTQQGSQTTIIRLTAAGALDPAFDGDGIQFYNDDAPSLEVPVAPSLAIDLQDRILVAGTGTGSPWAGRLDSTGQWEWKNNLGFYPWSVAV